MGTKDSPAVTHAGPTEVNHEQELTRKPDEVLYSIFDGIAETVLEASDDEIMEETREEGEDPLKKADEIRNRLLQATQPQPPLAASQLNRNGPILKESQPRR